MQWGKLKETRPLAPGSLEMLRQSTGLGGSGVGAWGGEWGQGQAWELLDVIIP